MFYGIPVEKQEDLRRILTELQALYPAGFHAQDMLVTLWKHLSFRSDDKFAESFMAEAHSDQEKSLLWRLHTLTWAGRMALTVEGDFVECGVYRGFCSAVVCRYLDFAGLSRRFYLYDTFSGLPVETSTEDERARWNPAYAEHDPDALYAEACNRFAAYDNVEIVRGVVPDSFEDASPEQIAFLHIDMNSAEAERLALESLFDRVVTGGVIVLDDFGWVINADQTRAERAFFDAHNLPILEIPTGQGLVIKR